MSITRALRVLIALFALLAVVGGSATATISATTLANDHNEAQTGPNQPTQLANDGKIGRSPPNLSVSVADTYVPDGGSITTRDNPTLAIKANGSTPIELVAVRIDGKTRRTFVPNTTLFEEGTTLDLNAGEHILTVVVETTDSTTTYTASVTEDSTGPLMIFESPFVTGVRENASIYDSPNSNYTLNRTRVQLRGTIYDYSNVERLVVETQYYDQGLDASWGFRNRTVIEEPNASVSVPLRLGPMQHSLGVGRNTLIVTLYDEYGHKRQYQTDLIIEDNSSATIEILDQSVVRSRSAIKLDIRVTDRVGIRSIGTRRGPKDGAGLKFALRPTPAGKRPVEYTFTRTIPLLSGTGNITIVADDGVGNATKRQLTVNYTELVTPRIELQLDSIQATGDRRVQVKGRVYDGRVTRVYVESITPDGDVIDLNQVYGGEITEAVSIDETLRMNVYPARIRVRAIDTTGEERIETVQLSQPNATSDELTPEGTEAPTQTRTPIAGVPAKSTTQRLLDVFTRIFIDGPLRLLSGSSGVLVTGAMLQRGA